MQVISARFLLLEKKKHSQQSNCALAISLDLIGDHWTLLIIRDLALRGLHEYKEFLESPEGISTNILSARLKHMLNLDLISSSPHPTNSKRKYYYLTTKGKALLPLIIEIFLWSDQFVDDVVMPERLKNALNRHGKEVTLENLYRKLEDWEQEHIL